MQQLCAVSHATSSSFGSLPFRQVEMYVATTPFSFKIRMPALHIHLSSSSSTLGYLSWCSSCSLSIHFPRFSNYLHIVRVAYSLVCCESVFALASHHRTVSQGLF